MPVKKLYVVVLVIILFSPVACVDNVIQAGIQQKVVIESAKEASSLGLIDPQELLRAHLEFSNEFTTHQPTASDIRNFKSLSGFDMVVFFGTWCHDSQREVPRLLKLIELSGVQLGSLQLVAVNQSKQLPPEYAATFTLDFTPTFYVTKDQQILATLIEKPKQTITKDLLSQILF